ncbi:hypothetical protein RJ40_00155 [Methanofollis aquaemaris]|uniref:Uncharacterized protein n=1 Tax=Methanofollis aquaemaris TaxID=126734 RepID=A0A8A3S1R8_9EURY|nr:hypothetical protein [Methanofollis aquaemaris]QSZ66023.1 hypothetical protein RJ40_00155 [Methanofollis aquaemaris]
MNRQIPEEKAGKNIEKECSGKVKRLSGWVNKRSHHQRARIEKIPSTGALTFSMAILHALEERGWETGKEGYRCESNGRFDS